MSIDRSEEKKETPSWLAMVVDFVLRRTVLVLVAVFAFAAALLLWNQMRLANRLVDTAALAEAKRYSKALATFRTLYTRDVVETVRKQNIEVTHDFDHEEKRGKAIPLPATLSMKLGNELTESQGGGFTRLYSNYPFPYPNRAGLRDEFAKDAWQALNETPDEPFYREETVDGQLSLRFAISDLMRQSCVDCHNSHPDTPKSDWKKGDVRGVLEVTLPLDAAEQQVATSLGQSFVLLGVLGVIGIGSLAIVIGRLRRTTVELEERVEERTFELKKAHDAAESANRSKSAFLANMSHEIRTPMNAVIGLTELMLNSQLDDIQRDYLNTVMDSSESLLSIINDILDFSKIEADKLEFEQVEFNLDDAVGDTVRSQALRAERKDLELACFVDPAIPSVLLGDPGRLRQVLLNLVGNAIKFTESGEVVVRVEQAPWQKLPACESEEDDRPIVEEGKRDADPTTARVLLHFSVADTGIGIEPGNVKSIFEPFEQADMSTTREYGGTGLGLAICQKLVGLMGGEIAVDSEPGRGSTFRFTAGLEISDRRQQPESMPTELKGARVLVVDDNATNRTILEQILLAREMAPVTAPSAIDGFAQLQNAFREGRPFRLLITDVHMPKIDGFGFVEMIRADTTLSDLDIIILTSTGQQGDQQRCDALRVAAQLTKPVKQSDLYNVILRAMGLDQVAAENGWLSVKQAIIGELPPLRILLVEDSLANQKVALAVLSGLGHTIVVANHGKEALAILSSQDFDVILMDIQMPEMDGFEATAAIRAAEDTHSAHQPIVAMTAHAMSGDRERCLSAGMDAYVAKPVRREDLLAAIAAAMGLEYSINRATESSLDSPAKLVDWTAPLTQLSGDHATLKDITQSYLDETNEYLPKLATAIDEGDTQEVRRLAHTVKGAMRFFHAEDAKQCGQELEELAQTGDLTTASELFNRFKAEVNRVLPVLQRFLDTGEM